MYLPLRCNPLRLRIQTWILIFIFVTTAYYLHGRYKRGERYDGHTGISTEHLNKVFTDFGYSETGKILQQRREQLSSYCHGKETTRIGHNSEKVLKKQFYYDLPHKIVFCFVQKVGSTFWKRLLKIISGHSKNSSPFDIASEFGSNAPTFEGASFDFIHSVLEVSHKFIMVRDPYSRLFSAYANKFFLFNPQFMKVVGGMILKRTRKNATRESLQCGHDITFPEIVKYTLDTEKTNWGRDDHLTPISDLCHPCQIKYDIIAKMETYESDTLFFLEKINLTQNTALMKSMKHIQEGSELDTISINTRHLLEDMKTNPECLSRAERLRRLWRNFQFTGIFSKDMRYPLTPKDEDGILNIDIKDIFERTFRESGPRELRLKNRQLVLEEAYSKVPLSDLEQLSELFKNDCGAFGYDCRPDYIFKRKEKPKSNFLDVWTA